MDITRRIKLVVCIYSLTEYTIIVSVGNLIPKILPNLTTIEVNKKTYFLHVDF